MEQLKAVITAACLLSIAAGLCDLIRPDQQFRPQIRFLISLLFVIGLTSPLLHLDADLVLSDPLDVQQTVQEEKLADTAEALILEETARRTEDALRELLSQNGIACTEMEVSLHIDELQCISISEVRTECSDMQRGCALLEMQLGEGVTIHVAEAAE